MRPGPATDGNGFDIVSTYHQLLADNPDLTKPVVAIKALIALLDSVPSSTTHETIEILNDASERLKTSVRNPVPLLTGTHLFLWFTRQMLKEQDGNFDAVRQHLVKNGQLFAQRAINARYGVAEKGWRFVFPGCTVLTHGASRAVLCLLERAQKEIPGRFNVIYVRDEQNPKESDSVIEQLRSYGIPTSAINLSSVLFAMTSLKPRIDMVFLGGEVITEDGGIISRMGTCQIAQAAKHCNINTYVCGETHKFSAYYPDGPDSVGFNQKINEFTTTEDSKKAQEELVDWTVRPSHS